MADSRLKLSLNFLNQFFFNVHVFLWSYLNPRPGEGSAQVGRAAGGGARRPTLVDHRRHAS